MTLTLVSSGDDRARTIRDHLLPLVRRNGSQEVVYEPGGEMEHIYFPTTAIVSLLYTMENGSSGVICTPQSRNGPSGRSATATRSFCPFSPVPAE